MVSRPIVAKRSLGQGPLAELESKLLDQGGLNTSMPPIRSNFGGGSTAMPPNDLEHVDPKSSKEHRVSFIDSGASDSDVTSVDGYPENRWDAPPTPNTTSPLNGDPIKNKTPHPARKLTPKVSPKSTQKITPKITQKISPKMSPTISPKISPKPAGIHRSTASSSPSKDVSPEGETFPRTPPIVHRPQAICDSEKALGVTSDESKASFAVTLARPEASPKAIFEP